MTRTHKATDRDHVGLANGTAAAQEHLPRFFGKSGYVDNSPSTTKKQGGGKGNWYVNLQPPTAIRSLPMSPALSRYTSISYDVMGTFTDIALSTRGQAGMSELEDYDYNMVKPKRRSNSMSMAAGHSALKTKFEAIDPEAVVEYDEDIHGPDQHDLEKMSTTSSADTTGSVEEEEESLKEQK